VAQTLRGAGSAALVGAVQRMHHRLMCGIGAEHGPWGRDAGHAGRRASHSSSPRRLYSPRTKADDPSSGRHLSAVPSRRASHFRMVTARGSTSARLLNRGRQLGRASIPVRHSLFP